MSATTALLVALAAFFAAIADLVRENGFLDRIAKGVRGWWRRRHPLPLTAAEEAKAQDVVIDGRIVDLKEHVTILKDLVDAAKAAAAAAQESAAAAKQSAEVAELELARVSHQLNRWHEWAVRWWPVLRTDADRLGVPDPPAMTDTSEETS